MNPDPKNFISFTCLSIVAATVSGPAISEAGNRATELERPVRVVAEGMSGVLLKQVLDWNDVNEIDFSYKSDKLSDFDVLVFFVDEFQELATLSIIDQMGLKDNFTPEAGENPFMISVFVKFKEFEKRLPVIAIDRRQFYARDLSCHPPFLRDIILQFDPNAVAEDEENYRTASDCSR